MIDTVRGWLKQLIEFAMVLIGLGIVLQVLFPKALIFIASDVAGNLIGLIQQFSGAGLVGVIAVFIAIYCIRR